MTQMQMIFLTTRPTGRRKAPPMTGSAKQDCFEQELGRRRVLTIDASDAIVLPDTEKADCAVSN
jgi:hypothetical protein